AVSGLSKSEKKSMSFMISGLSLPESFLLYQSPARRFVRSSLHSSCRGRLCFGSQGLSRRFSQTTPCSSYGVCPRRVPACVRLYPDLLLLVQEHQSGCSVSGTPQQIL